MSDMVKSQELIYEYTQYDETEQKKFKALNGVDINIKSREFVAILGHNGSGKSTLAKHMNVLLKPTKGTLWIKNMDTNDENNIWNIRQNAGMVFQNPDNQIIATIVEEDVAFGPENLGIESSEIRKRVDNSLTTVGMMEYMKHSPSLLSGGQKQRIAIAGILAMKPDCIILDEPTAMLDPSGRKEVIDTIYKLNKEENITIILITHYMEETINANKIIVMNKGSVEMEGTPKEIFSQVEKIKDLGLDVPQVTETIYNLNKLGINLPTNILSIEEMVNTICEYSQQSLKDFTNYNEIYENKSAFEQNSSLPIIQIKNLTYKYSEGTTFEKVALNNINLEIQAGEFIGLIGHTGSGKSTLIQHLNALITPTSGEILLDGENINSDKKKLKSIRQKIGLVFQYPEHQLFEMTVYKDVAFGPTNMGLSKEEIDERVKSALNIVGINESIYEKSPFDLSGGQKRRVAIASVLAMKPKVLILDEPTAGLDPKGRDEILEAINDLHKKLKITVILVSHSMEDIAKFVDKIIVMNKGKVFLEGTPNDIFSQVDKLENIGLAAPQISYVIYELNKAGFNLPKDIYTVEKATKVLYEFMKDKYNA